MTVGTMTETELLEYALAGFIQQKLQLEREMRSVRRMLGQSTGKKRIITEAAKQAIREGQQKRWARWRRARKAS